LLVRKTNTSTVYPCTAAIFRAFPHPGARRRTWGIDAERVEIPREKDRIVSDIITITGIVGTEARAVTTAEGLAITSFRLASTQRRFDKSQEKWIDGETNWYSITTFRQLATNAAVSVKKGERILVTGRLRIREWENAGKSGTNIEIEADALGHDLSWGTAAFSRGAGSAPADASAPVDGSAASDAGAAFPSEADLAATEGADATSVPAAELTPF
jgi:single-strand DNA-binding protein